MNNEKPLYTVSAHGKHVFLEIGSEVVELSLDEARDLADTLMTYVLDDDLSELEAHF